MHNLGVSRILLLSYFQCPLVLSRTPDASKLVVLQADPPICLPLCLCSSSYSALVWVPEDSYNSLWLCGAAVSFSYSFLLYTKTHVFQCFQCIFHPNWFGTRLIYLLRVMWDSPGRGSRPQFHVLPISAHGTKAAMALRCRGLRGLQKNKQTFVVENRNLLRSTPFLRVSSCHV